MSAGEFWYKLKHWAIWLAVILGITGMLMLTSCLKKEPLWQLPPGGAEEMDQVAMGEEYDNCIFYKLLTKEQTVRSMATWHIALESAPSGWHIRLNGGRSVQAYNTGSSNFTETYTATPSLPWQVDRSTGNMDSTAIGAWITGSDNRRSKMEVYIIDMGLNAPVQYKKLQLLSVTDSAYTIRFANLDNTNEQEKIIRKSDLYTYVYLDLTTANSVAFEPPANGYDILFTRYRYMFYEDGVPTPYLVNGVLLNPVNTYALKADSVNFEAFSRAQVNDEAFSAVADTIGYNWKEYSFATNKYTIPANLYVVKDAQGNLWKLQFLDFYNDKGVKGYPKFRFQRL